MEIVISGRHTEVSERFRRLAEEKLLKIGQLAPKAHRTDVELSHERNPRQSQNCEKVEITVRGKGPVIRAEASAEDPAAALDLAFGKLLERLRRSGDRRKVHHGRQTPRSVRLSDDLLARLSDLAGRRGASVSSTIERLLDEALRREAHPGITFRDGPSGRRAGLVAGPDVDEVIRTLRAVQAEGGAEVVDDVARAMTLTPAQVHVAVAYYADHRGEVDERIEATQRAADEAEAAWRRRQEVQAGRGR